MSFGKKYSVFIITCIGFMLFLAGVAKSSTIDDIKTEIQHANTYFWFGIAEQGNMDSFYKGLSHINAAEKLLKNSGLTKKNDKLLSLEIEIQIEELRKDFINQMEVHFDTLHGVFPIVRLLTPTIFSDALTLGTFELVDDPAVMASTSAGLKLAKEVLLKWSRKPQLNVIINSNTGEELKHKEPNLALEQEVLYIFASLPKFFVHNSQEIRRFLTKEEYEMFQNGVEPLQHDIIEKLCARFDAQELLIVSINEKDVIDNGHFYIAQGHLYNIEQKEPINTFFQKGFSRDRNKYFWPVIFSFFIGLVISILFFTLAKNGWNMNKIFSLSGWYIKVPVIAYLIGRTVPWVLAPVLSEITPVPTTLFFVSFWWPCLTGAALFFIPVIIYLQLNRFFLHFDNGTFELSHNVAAILLSISIGVCFYLQIPFMLYWDSLIGFFRIICISLITGYVFYWFGKGLNKGLFKFNSTTMKSGVYLLPILFVLGGTMFFGNTFPIFSWWHSPHPLIGLCLLLLPLTLAIIYHNYINNLTKIKEVKPDEGKENNVNIADLKPLQLLIHNIKNHKYNYCETQKFKKNIMPLIDPLVDNKIDSFTTTWLEITGPDGCGKSAAANAVIAFLEENKVNIVSFAGQCRIQTNNATVDTPYEPFHDAFPSYLLDSLLVSQDDFFHKIGGSLNPADMVPSFLGLDGFFSQFDKDSAKIMDEQIQQKVFEDIADYIRRKAENNIVIISLDNMHEIDSASEKLLLFLQKQFPPNYRLPLFFIIITKENNNLLEEMENCIICKLANPDAAELAEILEDSFFMEKKSAKMISDRMDPMENKLSAMLHYIIKLAEDGELEESDEESGKYSYKLIEKYANSKYEELPVPVEYIEIIKKQLKKFDKKQIKILSHAACLGINFNLEILSRSLKNDKIIEILEEIENISGIVFDNDKKDGCFSFRDSITLEQVRNELGITFQGPPWHEVKEKIKNIHGKLAHIFIEKAEKEPDSIFDACIHFYASGSLNAEQTIQSFFIAADFEKKSYNFDIAKDYIKMAADYANHIGKPFNIEEEFLLIECEQAHIQDLNSTEIVDKCIAYYENNKEKVSDKLLKVMARVCYEAVRDIDRLFDSKKNEQKSNRQKYKQAGNSAIQLLLDNTTDKFPKAETYFYKAINEDEQTIKIDDLNNCISVLESINLENDKKVETLLSWAEDQLARQLETKDPLKAIQLFQSCIKRKEWLDDKPGLSRSLGGLGAMFLLTSEKQYTQARKYFQESLNYAKQISDNFGRYQRNYELGDSYLIEVKDSKNNNSVNFYQKALEYFFEGLKIVDQFNEESENKDRSLCFLFSGIMFCNVKLADWNGFNKYGNKLFELIKQESSFPVPELTQRVQTAIQIGSEKGNANKWAGKLKKSCIIIK